MRTDWGGVNKLQTNITNKWNLCLNCLSMVPEVGVKVIGPGFKVFRNLGNRPVIPQMKYQRGKNLWRKLWSHIKILKKIMIRIGAQGTNTYSPGLKPFYEFSTKAKWKGILAKRTKSSVIRVNLMYYMVDSRTLHATRSVFVHMVWNPKWILTFILFGITLLAAVS